MDSAGKWGVLLVVLAGCRPRTTPPPSLETAIAAEHVSLASLEGGEAVPADAVIVTARDRVAIAGDRFPIVRVPPDAAYGLPLADVRSDLYIPPLEEALAWHVADAGAPVTIAFALDDSVPYRVVAELLASAPSEAGLVLVGSARGTKTIAGVPLARLKRAVRLGPPTILVRDSGLHIDGCDDPVPPSAIASCLAALAKMSPELGVVGADPGVRWVSVLPVISIAAKAGFDEIALSVRGPS